MLNSNEMTPFAILIPAYQPELDLIAWIDDLQMKAPLCHVLVVDDGSTTEISKIVFETLQKRKNLVILHHPQNQGKGAALKTGFSYYLTHWSSEFGGLLTADADGQHLVPDVIKLMQCFQNRSGLWLGVRSFEKAGIPLKSSLGNIITRSVFRWFRKIALQDTQTGLRVIPLALIRTMLHSKAVRYEFELEMLLKALELKIPILEQVIQTVYINQNRGSHFNPILDSFRILFVFIRFGAVSLGSALIDFLIFSLLFWMSGHLGFSFWMARLASAGFNFSFNHYFSFKSQEAWFHTLKNYLLLALVLGFGSYGLTSWFQSLGCNVYLSKIFVESFLFFVSFWVQRQFVFK